MGIIDKVKENIKHFVNSPLFDEFFWIAILVGVGLSAFSLGMSYERERYLSTHPLQLEKSREIIQRWEKEKEAMNLNAKFFASKNGSVYYPIHCGAGKRIKEEHRVYFLDEEDAKNTGLTRSKKCEK